MRKSNAELGEENLHRLRHYLDITDRVPERAGKANISAIAIGAGVPRDFINRRADAKRLIANAVTAKGLAMPQQVHAAPGEGVSADLKRKVQQLEQKNAVLRAEVAALRRAAARWQHLEAQMMASGKLPR